MSLLVSILLSDILPIFAIASVGFLLARFAAVDVKSVSRVVFYGLLPCLAFRMLVAYDQPAALAGRLMLLAALIMAVMAVVGYAAAKGLALGGTHLRSFMMIVMFSNTGNYGLPVVRFAFGPQALTDATVFFMAGSVLTYVAASFFAGDNDSRVAGALERIWKMPSLIKFWNV